MVTPCRGARRVAQLFRSVGRVASSKVELPPDRLRRVDLLTERGWLLAQSGVPVNADAIAYEPVQRLLAVRAARLACRSHRAFSTSACAQRCRALFLLGRT